MTWNGEADQWPVRFLSLHARYTDRIRDQSSPHSNSLPIPVFLCVSSASLRLCGENLPLQP